MKYKHFLQILIILIFTVLFTSCAKKTIEIKSADLEKIDVRNASIRTTKIEIDKNYEEKQEIKVPDIDIISPKNNEVINGSRIMVMLNVSNFKLVTPDNYPKRGQGHIQVWIDNMEFRSSKTEFVFENASNGTHTIKAELMMSNNTVLPYSKTIKIFINKSADKINSTR